MYELMPWPFVFFVPLLLLCLIVAYKARTQAEKAQESIDALRARLDRLETYRPAAGPSAPDIPLATEIPAGVPIEPPPPERLPDIPPPPVSTEDSAPALIDRVAVEEKAALLRGTRSQRSADDVTEESETVGLEERLGSRMFVWVGALAIAVAGAFFVKFSFEKGLLAPSIRIALGMAFGAVLLGVGEFLRKRSTRIAQGVSAAGIAILFATLLSGVNLYHLIPTTLGFILLAGVTALAVLLSLRQGPFVALLGLVGGFLTPALVQTGPPQPSLFAYLFMLQVGLLAVTRRRGWAILAGLTLLGGMGWAAAWLIFLYEPDHSLWLGLYLLASVMSSTLAVRLGKADEAWGRPEIPHFLTWAATALGLVLICAQVKIGDFSTLEWGYLGLISAGCLVLARLDKRLSALAWLGSAAGVVLLGIWCAEGDDLPQMRFGMTLLSLGVLHAVGSYICLWGSGQAALWTRLSVLSAGAYLLTAHLCLDNPPPHMNWGATWALLAGLYILAGIPVGQRRTSMPTAEQSLAAIAVGCVIFTTVAIAIELEQARLSAVWALQIPVMALVDRRFRIPVLQKLAKILTTAVAIRLLLNGFIFEYPIGNMVLWNWTLYGYGLPILTLVAGAAIFQPTKDKALVHFLGGAAVALGLALISLNIRQYFHPGELGAETFLLNEFATLSIAWMAYGLALLLSSRYRPILCLVWGGSVVGMLGLVISLGACVIRENPLFNHHAVGATPVLNMLLYLYGLPAILCLLIAREWLHRGERPVARIMGGASLILLLVLLSLEVRQFFHGPFLDGHQMTHAEVYSYSAAWILFGATLLGLGIVTGGLVLRYASLVVILLAVGKVFLYDTRHLEDLYRVFSLLGMGISLLVLAYVYQRFVFRKPVGSTP